MGGGVPGGQYFLATYNCLGRSAVFGDLTALDKNFKDCMARL